MQGNLLYLLGRVFKTPRELPAADLTKQLAVFAEIPHIAEAAVVQPEQQPTPASGSEITVAMQ
jgi:hypothetical protein